MTVVYRFGRVVVDPASRRVLVDTQPVALGARALDVLLALIERRERLVTKDELLRLVWPGLVVEENNLQVQVSALRKVLGQDAIATVPGRGYRFALAASGDGAAPDRAAPVPKHNLPAPVASFVGRERELDEVERLLVRHRLVTLTGIGGIGKTRLALQVAATVRDAYADGVWFADLSQLSDPGMVAATVAAALGVAEAPGTPTPDLVARHAATRRFLLVLDNCEHVLHACAELANAVLHASAGARLLATSREPLHVAGEATCPLAPLPAPEAREPATVDALETYASVRLFRDRAQAAQPGFAVTPQSAPAVARICHDLDGIPLALELAAARVRTMAVSAIADRLADRFRLLKGSDTTALPRHQTLRATLDWSHGLLAPEERAVLGRLSVFAGGFELDAAEAVGPGPRGGGRDVLERLEHLVDKSLVAFDPQSGRYRLLETIRQYAQERLAEAGEEASARLAHLRYFTDLARRAYDEVNGPRQAEWQVRLDAERENLLAMHAHSRGADGGGEAGLTLAALLRWLPVTQHELWHRVCREALAHREAQRPTLLRCRALFAASFLAYLLGRYDEAVAWAKESLSIAEKSVDPRALAEAHYTLAEALVGMDWTESFAHIEAAYRTARDAGDALFMAHAAMGMGEAYAVQGRYDLAEPHYAEALALGRSRFGPGDVAIALFNLVMCDVALGSRDRAVAHLREAIPLGDAQRSIRHAFLVVFSCAIVAARCADWPVAARLLGAVEAMAGRHALAMEPSSHALVAGAIASTRAAIGEAAFDAAFAAGRELDDEAALSESLAWLRALPP